MEGLQAVALGGLMALGGVIVTALVTLTVQRRQATAPLRVHLFEKQLEAHTAVIRQLGVLHHAVARLMATRQVAGADPAEATRELNSVGITTMAVLDENTFFVDRTAGEAILAFVATCNRVRDGEPITIDQIGAAYGQAVATCQNVLTIPDLARETFRGIRPSIRPGRRR